MTTITTRHGGWIAVDHGGPYIDVFCGTIAAGAVDCINAWDYEKGERSALIPFKRSAVHRQLKDWVAENGETFYDNVVRYR